MDRFEARKKSMSAHNLSLLTLAADACRYVDDRIGDAVERGHFQLNVKIFTTDGALRSVLERLHALKFDVHVTTIGGECGHDLWIGWVDDQCDPGLNLDGTRRSPKSKPKSKPKAKPRTERRA